MARIKYSGLVDNIRGSIGGTTFQNNKHGYTIKRKPNMVHPRSPLQNARKASFVAAVKAWQQLSSAQRTDWNTWASTYPQYAKFNPTSQLTGYEVFVRNHSYIYMIGETPITAPAYVVNPTDTLTFSLELSGGVLSLDSVSTTKDATFHVCMFISRPFPDASNFIGTKTRYFYYFDNDDDNQNITSHYTALYGVLPSLGDRVALDYVQVSADNGQLIARIQGIYTIVAP